jgi:hypothetical protein
LLALIIASFDLSGAWIVPTIPNPVKDVNGVVINVGSTVKIIGTVTGLLPAVGGVIIKLSNPSPLPLIGAITMQFNGLQTVVGS